jgi:four helix bundle protein
MPKKIEKKYSISDELKERTYGFALRILELASMLPDTEESKVIKRQICKSGTSMGSNLEEADGSLTLNDFFYKVDTAFKECKETRYWLRLIIDRRLLLKKVVEPNLTESVELIKILSTIIYKCLQ